MAQSFDPGLTQRYTGTLRRVVNKDGSFNVHRRGGGMHLYLHLISLSWPKFFLWALLGFVVTNLIFASIFVAIGTADLQGADPRVSSFANAFFFSTQTLTTVGYGHLAPRGYLASSVAAIEATLGVILFAIITSLLYGRISRPSAKIVFSEQMVVAPFNGGTSIQFRIANYRPNILMDLEAVVLLMTVEEEGGQLRRKYAELTLERSKVYFFPLTWTIVHPIREDSPLFGRTSDDMARDQAELMILIRSFDDTFSQNVSARHSYTHKEIVWNARFEPAFHFDEAGDMVLELEKLHAISPQPAVTTPARATADSSC
ncbi:MAG: hypothetical protein H7Y20_19560 [Bryobacteraceae bacterium]|nr:hypothetical protein [Bryobacteraceae bacterium]